MVWNNRHLLSHTLCVGLELRNQSEWFWLRVPLPWECSRDISQGLQFSEDWPKAGGYSHSYIGESFSGDPSSTPWLSVHKGALVSSWYGSWSPQEWVIHQTARSKPQAFCELVSDVTRHPFCHILIIKSRWLKPTHISKGREMSLHLLTGGVVKNLWTYWQPT